MWAVISSALIRFACYILFIYSDHYVVNVGWITEKALAVSWLNRDQNQAILHMCEQKSAVESHFLCKQVSLRPCVFQ